MCARRVLIMFLLLRATCVRYIYMLPPCPCSDARASLPSSLLLEAAWGLSHVHEKGLVHCDIKAANIVVVGEGDENTFSAKIADFGIACGEKEKQTKRIYVRTTYIF